VDPFAYISHLSAMEYHGLTDRFSKILYLTTPPDSEWKAQAQAKMANDLRERVDAHKALKLPLLRRPAFDRLEGTRVELMRRSSRGAFKNVKSPQIRVATVGRVFLEMLREPECCGGIQHVVDTYQSHGEMYLSLIAQEVERHGTAIEKVRAGYLLDEVCRLRHATVDGWVRFAQRGGSRRLDPNGEYAPCYSDKWMLSINVASLMPGNSGGDQ
jgi:predicted transcriptional regulator of viral defense system